MDDNSKKEEFSYGYIATICSASGLSVTKAERSLDNQGIDLTIIAPATIKGLLSPRVDVQVKCTSQNIIQENVIKYPIPIKNYQELIERKVSVPRLLILVIVPNKIEEWIDVDQHFTTIRKCAYWISLEGYRESKNQTSVTVEIPKENLLTPESVLKIIENAAEKQERLLGLNEILEGEDT